ncbi:MAG: HlyD family efflux transporter periplasmic adaptor subunit [Planctomycetota bacterium]
MKTFFVLILLIGAVSAGYYWKYFPQSKPEEAPPPPTATVERGDISQVVSTTGRVVSNFDVELKCKASGQITKLPFDVSHFVNKGELLIELDPLDEQRMVKQSEVALTASQAKHKQALTNLSLTEKKLVIEKERATSQFKSAEAQYLDAHAKTQRLEKLWKEKLTSEEERSNAITTETQFKGDMENTKIRFKEIEVDELSVELKKQDITLAEVQVKLDEISLSVAQQRLSETKVFAPIDGVIAERNVQIGQIISSGISNVGGGTSIMILSDLSRMFMIASVDESDIGKVKLEQKVSITADAFPNKKFEGKVVRIATKGINTSNVVTFEVKIEIDPQHKFALKPEMTTNVNIIIEERKEVLFVPSEALTVKSASPQKNPPSETPDQKDPSLLAQNPPSEKKESPEEKKEGPPLTEQASTKENFGTEKRESRNSEKSRKKGFERSFKHYVFLLKKDGTTEEREVEIGITDGFNVEIIKGLEEGDQVILNKSEAPSRWRQGGAGGMRMNPMMMGGGGRRG